MGWAQKAKPKATEVVESTTPLSPEYELELQALRNEETRHASRSNDHSNGSHSHNHGRRTTHSGSEDSTDTDGFQYRKQKKRANTTTDVSNFSHILSSLILIPRFSLQNISLTSLFPFT